MHYRNDARKHLKRSEEELRTGDDERLKYAALELRMAMEALTYDRALAYKDEFPPAEYETWQAYKVMSVLLDIDPTADKDSSLAFGVEEEGELPPSGTTSLGAEKVLNMAILERHYHALGNYLHVPSMKQARAGQLLDFGNIRARCQEIAAFVAAALSSPVFNVTLGRFATLDCCMECGKRIRKRLLCGQGTMRVECHETSECRASYTVVDRGNGQVEWQPEQHELECANGNCKHRMPIWRREMELGGCWRCPSCNGQNTFVLDIHYEAGQ